MEIISQPRSMLRSRRAASKTSFTADSKLINACFRRSQPNPAGHGVFIETARYAITILKSFCVK